jgi:hypothetical protein
MFKTTSNSIGELSDGWIVASGRYNIGFKAIKQGYQEVYKDIRHDAMNHVIIAILVRENR